MLADEDDYIVGVDPHRDVHALAVVEAHTGAVVLEAAIAASTAGYRHALELADSHAAGRRAFAVEGSGSFGSGLTRFLTARGETVFEVGRLRRVRRSGGRDRCPRRDPGRTGRARARPSSKAACRRRPGSAASFDGRPRRRRQRPPRRALPAARPDHHRTRAVPQRAPAANTRPAVERWQRCCQPPRRRRPARRPHALRRVPAGASARTGEERELESEISALTRSSRRICSTEPEGPRRSAAAALLVTPRTVRNEAAFDRRRARIAASSTIARSIALRRNSTAPSR